MLIPPGGRPTNTVQTLTLAGSKQFARAPCPLYKGPEGADKARLKAATGKRDAGSSDFSPGIFHGTKARPLSSFLFQDVRPSTPGGAYDRLVSLSLVILSITSHTSLLSFSLYLFHLLSLSFYLFLSFSLSFPSTVSFFPYLCLLYHFLSFFTSVSLCQSSLSLCYSIPLYTSILPLLLPSLSHYFRSISLYLFPSLFLFIPLYFLATSPSFLLFPFYFSLSPYSPLSFFIPLYISLFSSNSFPSNSFFPSISLYCPLTLSLPLYLFLSLSL